MIRIRTATRVLLLLCLTACTEAADETSGPKPEIVIRDVHVVSMTSPTIEPRRDVLISGGRITAIVASDPEAAHADALVVEGAGRYLMPGLADMHVHLGSVEELPLYLASGVTLVRNLNGDSRHLAWRRAIERGELLGPRIATAGPILDGDPPVFAGTRSIGTPEAGRRQVRELAREGYDFVKIYSLMSRPTFDAILDESRKVGIPVVGHVPWPVGVEAALAAGQVSFEHLYGYVDVLESEASDLSGAWSFRRLYGAVTIDPNRLPALAARTREAGVWNCPTLVAIDNIAPDKELAELRARPYMATMPSSVRRSWQGLRPWTATALAGSTPELRRQGRRVRRQILAALHKAGAPIMLGTDAGALYVAPGYSVKDELESFVEAGLAPYDALATATRAPARFLGEEADRGTVEVGKRADLLLLATNPLEDVANAAEIVGVLVGGKWLAEAELRRLLTGR